MSLGESEYKVMFWNARGVRNKLFELSNLILTDDLDIIAVNETFLDQNITLPSLPGYNVVRFDKTNHSGGLMFIIKNSINFTELDCNPTQLFECAAIKIAASTPFVLIVIYRPGGSGAQALLDSHFQRDLLNLCSNNLPFFLVGDLNAKHRAWNCRRSNKAGKLLFNFLGSQPFFLSYPDSPTYSPASLIMSPSTIDLIITDGRIPSTEPRTIEKLSSDHFPIQFEINCRRGQIRKNVCFDYSRADWEAYGDCVTDSLRPLLSRVTSSTQMSTEVIDEIIMEITAACLAAQVEAVPQVQTRDNPLFIPSALLRSLITARNYFRRRVTRNRNIIDKFLHCEFKKRVDAEISYLKTKKFDKILLDCNYSHNKIYKVIKNKKHINLPNLEPPVPGGRKITSPQAKAEAIANNFAVNHNNLLACSNLSHTRTVNSEVNSFLNRPAGPPDIAPVSLAEVATQIKGLKINKASGLDNIPNRLIKHLPIVGVHLLLIVFKFCLNNLYFPHQWKIAKTIPIPKAGKDRKLITSYRPIALLSCIGKVFERIIHTRLSTAMEDLKCIPDFQFGFRRGHSTTHALGYLIGHTRLALRARKTTASLFFDVAKAFDSVWHNGLLCKMIRLGFSDSLIRLTASFLKNREFEVHVGSSSSCRLQIPYGVPQGSVLSPSLYNIFISDIPRSEKCKISLYADDTVIFASDRFAKRLVRDMRQYAMRIIRFYRKWKILINTEKTALLFHTRRRRRQLPPESITLNGAVVPRSTSVRYLGFHLDGRLTLKEHIVKSVTKADSISRALYPFIKRNNMVTKSLKVKIYRTYVRPALLYAAPVLTSAAQTNRNLLQIRQNKFLRMALSKPLSTRIVDLHEGSGVEFVDEFMERLNSRFSSKAKDSENLIIRQL